MDDYKPALAELLMGVLMPESRTAFVIFLTYLNAESQWNCFLSCS
jgi:hypothetical protein